MTGELLLDGDLYARPEDRPLAGVPQNFAPGSFLPTLLVDFQDTFGTPVENNIRPGMDPGHRPALSTDLLH